VVAIGALRKDAKLWTACIVGTAPAYEYLTVLEQRTLPIRSRPIGNFFAARASFRSATSRTLERETMAPTILTNCTRAKEDLERATLPLIVGNVAASADQAAIVPLTIDGVWLATPGYADGVHKEGFQPLKEIIGSFLENGAQIWACGACTKPRGITEEHLIPGARIVTAMVVEAMVNGASTLGF
jgi:uncharacterized protein